MDVVESLEEGGEQEAEQVRHGSVSVSVSVVLVGVIGRVSGFACFVVAVACTVAVGASRRRLSMKAGRLLAAALNMVIGSGGRCKVGKRRYVRPILGRH